MTAPLSLLAGSANMAEQYELACISSPTAGNATMPPDEADELIRHGTDLHKRTIRKLDILLLPFLALLFLFNSLDKSNVRLPSRKSILTRKADHDDEQIGNAESAHFTSDIGLRKSDLNTAVALFFAFFVALQPAGAALGRRYGMVLWVPSCMLLWGISTALHTWVRARWQLYVLRVLIGCLEGMTCRVF